MFRPDNANSGDFFGTGQWGVQARFTACPSMKTKAGTSCTWASRAGGGTERTVGYGNADTIDVAGSARIARRRSGRCGLSPQRRRKNIYLPDANSNRMIDTGVLFCNEEYLLGTELLYIRGPLSLQAEYGWNFLNNAQLGFTGTADRPGYGLRVQRRIRPSWRTR